MKLNCKPGDLAVIIDSNPVVNPDTGGVLCDVLHHPPARHFDLPDGTPARCLGDLSARWVIRLHRQIKVLWGDGTHHLATYAVCHDSKMRPIRDNPGADETLTWLDVPAKREGVPA